MENELIHKIFNISSEGFEDLSLNIFRFQYNHNNTYRSFVQALQIDPLAVHSLYEIPFLPISFFKTHSVQSTEFVPEVTFESSGTTQTLNSRHLIKNVS